MDIILVGCGSVGSAICAQLIPEGHNITAIDTDAEALNDLMNAYDVTGIQGNGALISVLRRAGADRARLIIAVTSSDEINILCCSAAKKLGTHHSIARVRNPEYTELMQFMKADMNLSLTINPELAAAKEIYRMLRFPSATKLETFCRGRVELAEFTITAESPFVGKTLVELRSQLRLNFLVCCILRGDDVIIPSGDYRIEEGDVLGVTVPEQQTRVFFKETGIYRHKLKDILIFGGSRVTYYLQELLEESKFSPSIIEKNKEVCRDLSVKFDNCTVVCDNGAKQEVLLKEGVESTDAFLALSDTDEENAIASMYANSIGVPKVITLINNMTYVDFFKSVGLQSLVSPKTSTALYILRYVRSKMNADDQAEIESLHRIMGEKAEAVEFIIKEDIAGLTGIPLKELKPKRGVLIICIAHKEQIIIPSGNDVISKGDTVVVVSSGKKITSIKDIMR
ncbi:MAG: Trk system potassium transporter TrkA [Clostridia bacterium]|nr:Trk system potassium transporter TrkA [Clostridia bacterium]MBQ3870415.1 Trk system potassium transporter TrkA [Clostridia bacterium]